MTATGIAGGRTGRVEAVIARAALDGASVVKTGFAIGCKERAGLAVA